MHISFYIVYTEVTVECFMNRTARKQLCNKTCKLASDTNTEQNIYELETSR